MILLLLLVLVTTVGMEIAGLFGSTSVATTMGPFQGAPVAEDELDDCTGAAVDFEGGMGGNWVEVAADEVDEASCTSIAAFLSPPAQVPFKPNAVSPTHKGV